MAAKRLKELLESRKASRETSSNGIYTFAASSSLLLFDIQGILTLLIYAGIGNGNGQGIQVLNIYTYKL